MPALFLFFLFLKEQNKCKEGSNAYAAKDWYEGKTLMLSVCRKDFLRFREACTNMADNGTR